jgi:hypothetical protein
MRARPHRRTVEEMKRTLVVLLLFGVVGGTVALMAHDDAATPTETSVVAVDPHGAEIADVRTLIVSRAQPPVSQPGLRLNGRLVEGSMPGAPTVGTVLTDDDCAADPRGVSNCLNRIRLADGREIAVRHPHRMQDVPCFAPGEHVRVVPA